MGELFANFEAYDVQATRKEQQEEDIEKMIKILKELGIDAETVKGKLKEKFGLEETEIDKKIKMYW